MQLKMNDDDLAEDQSHNPLDNMIKGRKKSNSRNKRRSKIQVHKGSPDKKTTQGTPLSVIEEEEHSVGNNNQIAAKDKVDVKRNDPSK